MPKTVLITGASTGIGRACVVYLAARGWRVYAGVRRSADGESLAKEAGRELVRPVRLDVTDAATIAAAAEQLDRELGADGLAGLVNNAGISVVGPVEFVSLDEWKRQFEVNFFGQIAVTQAALPLLRRHSQTHGLARLVFMSSIGGRIAQPILGPYTASKFAVEALADSLRVEVAGQGIRVCVVQPGAVQSEIWRKGEESVEELDPQSPMMRLYGGSIRAVERAAGKAASGAISADHVARVVERCLISAKPSARYLVGRDAKFGALAKKLLPTPMFDRFLARAMGLES